MGRFAGVLAKHIFPISPTAILLKMAMIFGRSTDSHSLIARDLTTFDYVTRVIKEAEPVVENVSSQCRRNYHQAISGKDGRHSDIFHLVDALRSELQIGTPQNVRDCTIFEHSQSLHSIGHSASLHSIGTDPCSPRSSFPNAEVFDLADHEWHGSTSLNVRECTIFEHSASVHSIGGLSTPRSSFPAEEVFDLADDAWHKIA